TIGYSDTLSAYPYDWRQTLESVAQGLFEYISAQWDEDDQRVSFVTMGEGGLIVAKVIDLHPELAEKISAWVSVGTPYLGRLSALTDTVTGHGFDYLLSQTPSAIEERDTDVVLPANTQVWICMYTTGT
ncbi:lecithin:cholesterol/ phospholipid:diacylglycerol acyltransferase, partial [Kipferlia bialata]